MNSFNLYVDRKVVDEVNFKKKDLLCVLALMLESYKRKAVCGEGIVEISCTPSTLWDNVVWKVKPTHTDRKNFMESFNRLVESGLVEIVESSSQKITWSTLLHLDIEKILHEENNSFIAFCTDTFEFIEGKNYATLSTLLQLYLSIISYFDMSQIREFDEAIRKGESPIDYTYEFYGEMNFHVSCWASYKRLMTTKHSSDTKKQQWISDKTLTKMLSILEDAQMISIVRIVINGEQFPNHYCYPRHKKYVEKIAKHMAEQQLYARVS